MKLQFFNTWFTLTKHSTMMQVRFSWAYNLIYTFTKLILRMQIYFTLCMSLTLSQILPCTCKSFWRHFTFIPLTRGVGQGVIVELSNRGPWRGGAHNDKMIIIINMINEVLCCEGPTPLVVWLGPNIWCYAPASDPSKQGLNPSKACQNKDRE